MHFPNMHLPEFHLPHLHLSEFHRPHVHVPQIFKDHTIRNKIRETVHLRDATCEPGQLDTALPSLKTGGIGLPLLLATQMHGAFAFGAANNSTTSLIECGPPVEKHDDPNASTDSLVIRKTTSFDVDFEDAKGIVETTDIEVQYLDAATGQPIKTPIFLIEPIEETLKAIEENNKANQKADDNDKEIDACVIVMS